nr:BTB/POZ domain-containing protein 1-like [Salvelinus alpinus]
MATGGGGIGPPSNLEGRASNFAHSGAGRNAGVASNMPIPVVAAPISPPSGGLHREPMYNWQATKSSVKERFAFLFNNELLSDVRFIVGKGRQAQRIPAHKFVLAAGSAVFDAMFNGGMATTSAEIELPDVEPAAFLALLRFLYSDEVHIGPETG